MAQYSVIENDIVINVIEADEDYIKKIVRRNPLSKCKKHEGDNKGMKGGLLDDKTQKFIPIKPYDDWVLDKRTLEWKSPKDSPKDNKEYQWDAETKDWLDIEEYKLKYRTKSPKTDKNTKI